VGGPSLPAWDLVVCTVGRTAEPTRLLDSLTEQSHRAFRVVLVDQNADERLTPLLERHPDLDVLRLTSAPGLSRARNAALSHLRAELVAFPDDDCTYPHDLLERAARRFAEVPSPDAITGRDLDMAGGGSRSWDAERRLVTPSNVWYHGLSAAVFLRRSVVERVGAFDEQLGLGSGTPWASGEEVDYLIRAAKLGARIEYDPELAVQHEVRKLDGAALRAIGKRDGGSVGYLLRKHAYPSRTVARLLVRPVGGAVLSLARLDPARAGFHIATLGGRVRGYSAGRPD
jgi:glycosyltransferase involved in cell wall biosynthesis